MKLSFASGLAALVLAGCAHVRPTTDATSSLVAAERAFAADASARTADEAFLAVLADDAVLLRPTPVPGRTEITTHPSQPTTLLRWAPTYAEISADGTLGLTTGPYEVGRRGEKPVGRGHFVSVWRRTAGKWQLVLDGGAPGPIEVSIDSAATRLRMRAGARRFAPDTMSLLSIERSLNRERAQPTRAIVAPSGDLGYVYGIANGRGYARIYRRDAQGNWQLIIDTLDPHVT